MTTMCIFLYSVNIGNSNMWFYVAKWLYVAKWFYVVMWFYVAKSEEKWIKVVIWCGLSGFMWLSGSR